MIRPCSLPRLGAPKRFQLSREGGRLNAALLAVLLVVFAVFAAPRSAVLHARGPGLASRLDSCSLTGVSRVVAVGDVHGEYRRFVAVLQQAGVIDADGHWAGGSTHLVQTGDVVDRGPESRRVLDLLMRLEREARTAGGRVHALLGNHEVMVMLGDLRYTSAEEIQAFAPAGLAELRRAFGADGNYGRWLRTRDAIINIDGVLFVHGGISPSVAALGCAAINRQIRWELTAGFAELSQHPLASLTARPDGPLWFRGLAQDEEAAFAHEVEVMLRTMRAHTIVIGHTISSSGRVTPRFGGRVIQIDTGMLASHYPHGQASALELQHGRLTAIYEDGREAIAWRAADGPFRD